MKPGDMITPEGGSIHTYEKMNPIDGYSFNSIFEENEVGLVVDFHFFSNDVIPYVRILTPRGVLGWVSYERLRVVNETR